jgi:hypothetical protein
MAEIIETLEDTTGTSDLPNLASEAPTEPVDTAEPAEPSVVESIIPDKYKGKSFEDIMKMHQEAEKLIGRQAQEVGEVRKLADDLIKSQLNTKAQAEAPAPVVDNELDYFSDPDKAVNRAVENNPLVKQLKEQQEAQMRQTQATKLQEKFPDFQSIVASDDFANWIKSSRVRLDLFAKANNYDFDSAEELLETYTTIKGIKSKQADEALIKEDTSKRSEALKSATVQRGSNNEVSKPIYRRTDLIRLRMQDPERYNAMQDEIFAAYDEGRVK